MNKVFLVGNLARDPEVRYTQTGKAVASFSIAVNRFSGSAGSGQSTADFIPIVAWDKLAEICGNNLIKGRKILVEGRMQVRNYEGKDGMKRYVTEVIAQNIEFMDSRQSRPADEPGMPAAAPNSNSANAFGSEVFPDEEIPF